MRFKSASNACVQAKTSAPMSGRLDHEEAGEEVRLSFLPGLSGWRDHERHRR